MDKQQSIIYNTQTQQVSKIYPDLYVNLFPQGKLKEHELNLIVINLPTPEHDTTTHRAVALPYVVDVEAGTYTRGWEIVPLSEQEQIDMIMSLVEQIQLSRKELAKERLAEQELEVINQEVVAMDDATALDNPTMFPPYDPNNKEYFLVNPDTGKADRFYYPVDGKLYKVLQDHTSAIHWRPNEAVSLYETIQLLPEGDLCDTAPAWVSGNWGQYTVDFHVKHNNAIWKAKNTTHTYIAPDHTGNGAISWTFIKDCI